MKKKQTMEDVVHGVFLFLGLITVGCVLLITVYLIVSGLPAISKIGLGKFLFGSEWASTAAEAKFGILPFILTSVYGTCGAILIGVPVGFLTAVFLSKMAPKKLRTVMESAVSLLAGIPSVVYGLVGMLVLVPGIRKLFHVPDGASLLAAIIVLAIMILPSIINVAMTALEAVPREYEDGSAIIISYSDKTRNLFAVKSCGAKIPITLYPRGVEILPAWKVELDSPNIARAEFENGKFDFYLADDTEISLITLAVPNAAKISLDGDAIEADSDCSALTPGFRELYRQKVFKLKKGAHTLAIKNPEVDYPYLPAALLQGR